MSDGLNFGGVDLSCIKWNIDGTRNAASAAIEEVAQLQAQAQRSALVEYEKDWEWRDQQTELLNQIIEEQRALAKGSEKSYKAALWAAVFAGVGVIVTILIAVLPIIFSRFGQ